MSIRDGASMICRLELQQEVEVARAVSAHSKVLILDEATSAPPRRPPSGCCSASTSSAPGRRDRVHLPPPVLRSTAARHGRPCCGTAARGGLVPLPETGEARVKMMVGRRSATLQQAVIEQREPVLEGGT
jgi:ribose transport system ATP-binding protein